MAVDVLQFNAIAKKVEIKRGLLKEKTKCRDSAAEAQVAYDPLIACYDALIDSADSFIANASASYGFTPDSDYYTFYNHMCNCRGYNVIKDLDDFATGTVTTVCVWDNDQSRFSGGCSCAINANSGLPAGTTRLGIEIIGPGNPSKGVNCCGGSSYASTGAFMAIQFVVTDPATTCLVACSGCACCCSPYCSICGSGIFTPDPAYICGTLNGQTFCIRANNAFPGSCSEMVSRKCGATPDTSYGWCKQDMCNQNSTIYASGNCCGWDNYCAQCNNISGGIGAKYWFSQCGCGSGGSSCGSSVCNEGYGTCFLIQCRHNQWGVGSVFAMDMPHVFNTDPNFPNFCLLYGGSATAPIGNDTSSPFGAAGMVAGSCFAIPILHMGGKSSNNCFWFCHPGNPFCRGAGWCCKCEEQCCPAYLFNPNQCNGWNMPGNGAHPHMTCGGYTGMDGGRGRTGAIRVKYC